MTTTLRRAAVRALLCGLALWSTFASAADILFIGNSFTYAAGSAVRTWRADSVSDLNAQGIGGMPALFKAFTQQAGLKFDVSLETQGGVGIDWHLQNKLGVIGQRPWDVVVMHGYSTLDAKKPGDPATLIASTKQMAEFLASRNPGVDVRLLATWARADQTYEAKGAWFGKPIQAMGTGMGTLIPTMPTWMRRENSRATWPSRVKTLTPLPNSWALMSSMAASRWGTCTQTNTGPKISSW